MSLEKLRKLVALDPADPLSRFALGRKLIAESDPALVAEGVDHLRFAVEKSPGHLASYHQLATGLIKLGRPQDARPILLAGIDRTAAVGEGMGRDLGPAMEAMLREIEHE